MNPDLSDEAITTIESLCTLGCSQVNQMIDDAKNGNRIDALSCFKDKEIEMIITELSQIMAVYNNE